MTANPVDTATRILATAGVITIIGGAFLTLPDGGLHVLNLFTFPNGHVLGATEMTSLADMRGRRMTSLNPTRQDIASAVGGVPVSLSISGWYQGLNRRTVDAAIESYSAVPPFRLAEVTSHFIELPLGGNASFMFMNKEVYDGQTEGRVHQASLRRRRGNQIRSPPPQTRT